MARKVVSRKQLRAEAEAAEAAEKEGGEAAPKKKAKAKRAPKKKKVAAEVRLRLFWGVFNQQMRVIAKYPHNAKKQAQQKADELSQGGKSPHFVMPIKEEISE